MEGFAGFAGFANFAVLGGFARTQFVEIEFLSKTQRTRKARLHDSISEC